MEAFIENMLEYLINCICHLRDFLLYCVPGGGMNQLVKYVKISHQRTLELGIVFMGIYEEKEPTINKPIVQFSLYTFNFLCLTHLETDGISTNHRWSSKIC